MYWISLLVWLGICFAVAGADGWLTAAEIDGWYQTLKRPAIAPPNGVFGPVWTLLYALMAVAAWQVWRSEPSLLRTVGIALFTVQLTLNLAWSWLFFHRHKIGVALADVPCRRIDALGCGGVHYACFWPSHTLGGMAHAALPGLAGLRGRFECCLFAAQSVIPRQHQPVQISRTKNKQGRGSLPTLVCVP